MGNYVLIGSRMSQSTSITEKIKKELPDYVFALRVVKNLRLPVTVTMTSSLTNDPLLS